MNASSLLPALLELTEGPGEPSLPVIPVTCRPTHLRAASAAEREQIGVTGPLHESHDRAGPLLEPAHVQGDFGGEVGRAIQITESPEVRRFSGRAGGHAGVESGHPFFDQAQSDLGEPGPAQSGQLQIRVPSSPGNGERTFSVFERVLRIDARSDSTSATQPHSTESG